MRIEGIESRRRSAGALHIVIGFFMIMKAADYYKLISYHSFLPVIPLLIVGSFSLFYGFFRKRTDPLHKYNYWLRLVQVIAFSFLGFLVMKVGRTIDFVSVFIFVFLGILMLFSERRIFTETLITLNNEAVRIPGYYRDHIVPWQDISDLVVREDFITIFHRKGKYLQYQVLQDLSTLEVAKLNAFAKEKIEATAA